jgi:uncharacterized protein YbaP (TraB family)
MKTHRSGIFGVAAGVAVLAVMLAALHSAAKEKTSLWRVTSKRGAVYLLGSIHMLTEDDYPLDARMERAFEESDVVVFEVDPDSLQSPAVQAYVLENAMCGEGESLQSIMGDAVWRVAAEKAESLGVDIRPLHSFKPWFVSLALAVAELQKLGFDSERGVELHFARRAREAGKTVSALETALYQLGLFVGLSPENQRALLLHTLSQLSDIESEIARILDAWRSGSLDDLQETLNKSFDEYPEIYEKLIIQRNLDWIRRIEAFLASGKTHLVIVGVGHMAGERGLIELLAKKGFAVEQL